MSDAVFQPPLTPNTEIQPFRSGLGKALWIVMIITAVSYLFNLFAYVIYAVEIGGSSRDIRITEDVNTIIDAYDVAQGWNIISTLLNISVFVLLVIFLYKFVKKVRILGHQVPMSQGLAIGGWFIPLAQVVIPFLFFRRIADVLKDAKPNLQLFLNLWWWPWVLGVVLQTIGRNQNSFESFDDMLVGALLCITGLALWIIGLIFGILFVAKSNNISIPRYEAPLAAL